MTRPSWSPEATGLARSLPYILLITLAIKAPMVVLIFIALIELILQLLTTTGKNIAHAIRRHGRIGAATAIVYPFTVTWAVFVGAVTTAFGLLASYLAGGLAFLSACVTASVAAVIVAAFSALDVDRVYATILPIMVNCASLFVIALLMPEYAQRIWRATTKKLYNLSEGMLMATWTMVVCGVALVFLFVNPPWVWPLDITPKVWWPFDGAL